MPKQKTKKTLSKKVKITGTGKMLRRHQFAAGSIKASKSKSALEAHKKTKTVFKTTARSWRKLLGI